MTFLLIVLLPLANLSSLLTTINFFTKCEKQLESNPQTQILQTIVLPTVPPLLGNQALFLAIFSEYDQYLGSNYQNQGHQMTFFTNCASDTGQHFIFTTILFHLVQAVARIKPLNQGCLGNSSTYCAFTASYLCTIFAIFSLYKQRLESNP